MKKRLFVLAALVMILAILATGTLAYFTTKAVTHNVITTGSVGITVLEHQRLEDGTIETYPEGEVKVMPGSEISKIVTIRNDEAESYIRACIEIIVTRAGENPVVMTVEEASEFMTINVNTSDWLTKEGDTKWLYYKKTVPTGQPTSELFTTVTFDGDSMDNDYMNCRIEINIAGQAVQAANNESTVLTALGWPD